MSILSILIAQLNFCVGDIEGNKQKIIQTIQKARGILTDLIVFPELALSGYPPEDLLFRRDFQEQIMLSLHSICQASTGLTVLLGHPDYKDHKIFNAASFIQDKKIISTYHKQYLPNYGVFDEKRYFSSGDHTTLLSIKNTKIGVLICEDMWYAHPMANAVKQGAKLIIGINASPFNIKKEEQREQMLLTRFKENKVPIFYVNTVGVEDDLVFDGASRVINAHGVTVAHAAFFKEECLPISIQTTDLTLDIQHQTSTRSLSEEESIYQALILAIYDYVNKNNFSDVLVAVSGGIDSALTTVLAVDALGKDRVHTVFLPSRYTSSLSERLVTTLVKKLGVTHHSISIEPLFKASLMSLSNHLSSLLVGDITEQNIQTRCRSLLLMAFSNKTGKLLLSSSNKSELATGYSSIYGDMAGGYAVLKDLSKTFVYRLVNYRNTIESIIPEEIITRAPTAELATQQKDEDSLPPYPTLDAILEMYVEQDKSIAEIAAAGFEKKLVKRLIQQIECNEYKRRQAPPGPRISSRALDRERRYPITSKFLRF